MGSLTLNEATCSATGALVRECRCGGHGPARNADLAELQDALAELTDAELAELEGMIQEERAGRRDAPSAATNRRGGGYVPTGMLLSPGYYSHPDGDLVVNYDQDGKRVVRPPAARTARPTTAAATGPSPDTSRPLTGPTRRPSWTSGSAAGADPLQSVLG